MKKAINIFFVIIILFCAFATVFILLDDDFVVKEKNQEVNIGINCENMQCIKTEVEKIISEYFDYEEDMYLGNLMWEFASKQEFDNKLGNVTYTYYLFRGRKRGYDLYIESAVTVDLKKEAVTNIRSFGNRTTGGNAIQKFSADSLYDQLHSNINDKIQDMSDNINIKIDMSSTNTTVCLLSGDNILDKGYVVEDDIVWE